MITKEKGWGIFETPLLYPANGYKNIAFVENKETPLFLVNNVLSAREGLPLMGITLPLTLISGNIIAPIKEELPIEVAIELMVDRTIDPLAQEIARTEKICGGGFDARESSGDLQTANRGQPGFHAL